MGNLFDPMTGKRIQKEGEEELEMLFDPMTGERIQKEREEELEMLFDPMTGERIQKEREEELEMLFDPMTGERIQKEREEESKMLFDPMTGKPIQKKKNIFWKWSRKKSSMRIGIVIVTIFIIGFIGLKSDVFYGNSTKVLLAVKNTLNDRSKFMKEIHSLEILKNNKYTINMDLALKYLADNGYEEEKEVTYRGNYISTKSEKQLVGDAWVSGMNRKAEINAILNTEQMKVQIPTIDDIIYFYNHKERKTGYITEMFDKNELEGIDKFLNMAVSDKKQKKTESELKKILFDAYKKLEFDSVGKKDFRIDGKNRSCKGYCMVYTKYDYIDLMDEIQDYIEESDSGLDNIIEYVTENSVSEYFREQKSNANDMPDIEFTFYLYKGKLASIELEVEREGIEILFHGGSIRTENIEVLQNGKTVIEIDGKIGGVRETGVLLIDGEQLSKWEYDSKTGDFKIEIGDESEAISVDGNIQSKWRNVTCEIQSATYFMYDEYDEYDEYYEYKEELTLRGSIVIKKGAKIKEMEGRGFDIGEGSYEELKVIEEKLNDI